MPLYGGLEIWCKALKIYRTATYTAIFLRILKLHRNLLLDLDAYLEKISVLKKIYKDKIDVRIGVEQGLQPHLCEQINNYDPAHRLDFIIGSTHLVDGSDPYYPSFWEHHSPKESICTYFENIYKSICCCDNFDVTDI